MRVSRLILKNWRNFRSVDVKLAQRVFVVGPNASGKSNFLDALRFLRDIARPEGSLQAAVKHRGGLSKVRCLAARSKPDVEIAVELSENGSPAEWTYAIVLTQEERGFRRPRVKSERVTRHGRVLLDRPGPGDRDDPERLVQTHLEQINSNAEFREIARFFSSFRYLHLVPQLLRHPEAFQGPGLPDDPYGRNFLELVAKTPENSRKKRLQRIEAALREAVPQLKDLSHTKDDAGVPHLEAVYEHWRPNAGLQREDQFSDGTLRLIGLFWSLLEGDTPLLLEEPELSLHAAIVKKLPGLFHRLQRRTKRQVLISTHSEEMLGDKGIGGEEVIVLTPDPEGTKAELASAQPEIRIPLEAGLSIADVVLPRTAPAHLGQLDLFE